MSKAPKTAQNQTQDRRQMQVFESTYGYLVSTLQNIDPSVKVIAERLRLNMNRDRIARGTITIQSGKKSAKLGVAMQGERVCVDGEKVHALPKTAPKGRPGYSFESRESAAAYVIEAADAFLLRAQK